MKVSFAPLASTLDREAREGEALMKYAMFQSLQTTKGIAHIAAQSRRHFSTAFSRQMISFLISFPNTAKVLRPEAFFFIEIH